MKTSGANCRNGGGLFHENGAFRLRNKTRGDKRARLPIRCNTNKERREAQTYYARKRDEEKTEAEQAKKSSPMGDGSKGLEKKGENINTAVVFAQVRGAFLMPIRRRKIPVGGGGVLKSEQKHKGRVSTSDKNFSWGKKGGIEDLGCVRTTKKAACRKRHFPFVKMRRGV